MIGAVIGSAVGDALGAPFEFGPPGAYSAPTSVSWASPIGAQFGPSRSCTMVNSNDPNHTVLARDLHACLRWRNANARHPDVLAAQRRERARVRGERQQRWGRPRTRAA